MISPSDELLEIETPKITNADGGGRDRHLAPHRRPAGSDAADRRADGGARPRRGGRGRYRRVCRRVRGAGAKRRWRRRERRPGAQGNRGRRQAAALISIWAPATLPILFLHGFGADLQHLDVRPSRRWPRGIARSANRPVPGMAARPKCWISRHRCHLLRRRPRPGAQAVLGIDRFHLVGHSMGGGDRAQSFALWQPERVASSTLIAARRARPGNQRRVHRRLRPHGTTARRAGRIAAARPRSRHGQPGDGRGCAALQAARRRPAAGADLQHCYGEVVSRWPRSTMDFSGKSPSLSTVAGAQIVWGRDDRAQSGSAQAGGARRAGCRCAASSTIRRATCPTWRGRPRSIA